MPDEPLSRSEFWQRIAVALLGLFGVLASVITLGISFAKSVTADNTASNAMLSQQITSISTSLVELRLVNERRLTQLEERQIMNIRSKDDHEARLNALERAKPK